jgi:hypothetical protein
MPADMKALSLANVGRPAGQRPVEAARAFFPPARGRDNA